MRSRMEWSVLLKDPTRGLETMNFVCAIKVVLLINNEHKSYAKSKQNVSIWSVF